MVKTKIIAFTVLLLVLTYGCDESVTPNQNDTENKRTDTESITSNVKQKVEEVAEVKQSVDDRILEIKALYATLQGSQNMEKKCTSKSKTNVRYDIIESGFQTVNKAKECQLDGGFMYQQVEINGYEWGEKCSFYYKEDKRFFTYLTGGAEGCGYDYRIYYDREGEIIRVLLAENDCDGLDVSGSREVTNEKRKQEILNSIASAEKEFKSILKK